MSDLDPSQTAGRVRDFVAAHPGATIGDVAAALGLRRGPVILATLGDEDIDVAIDDAGQKHFTLLSPEEQAHVEDGYRRAGER